MNLLSREDGEAGGAFLVLGVLAIIAVIGGAIIGGVTGLGDKWGLGLFVGGWFFIHQMRKGWRATEEKLGRTAE